MGGQHRLPASGRRRGLDRSYGIQVAQLAGLPETVINRAFAVLQALENSEASGAKWRRWGWTCRCLRPWQHRKRPPLMRRSKHPAVGPKWWNRLPLSTLADMSPKQALEALCALRDLRDPEVLGP